MEIYEINQDNMTRLPETDVEYEENLENRLVQTKAAKIGGVEILYIGRQGTTEHGKYYDIVGVDKNGDIVIVELKRDETPRKVIAQALDYTSRLRHRDYNELQTDYEKFLSEEGYVDGDVPSLLDAHQDHFDLDEPLSEDEFNNDQRVLIIGGSIDDATTNMADYLRDRGGIDVVLVEYSLYHDPDEETELLTTNAIRRPLEEEPAAQSEKSLNEKQQRRRDFWSEFQSTHREYNLSGGTVNESASYTIYVFESGRRNRPATIRPKAGYNKVENAVKFYENARNIARNEELQEEFEKAVRQASSQLTTESDVSSEAADNLIWDLNETRDFDLVTLNYEDVVHNDFQDQDAIKDIKNWLIDTSRIYEEALIQMKEDGYISPE
jgi:hypothetical protein